MEKAGLLIIVMFSRLLQMGFGGYWVDYCLFFRLWWMGCRGERDVPGEG